MLTTTHHRPTNNVEVQNQLLIINIFLLLLSFPEAHRGMLQPLVNVDQRLTNPDPLLHTKRKFYPPTIPSLLRFLQEAETATTWGTSIE